MFNALPIAAELFSSCWALRPEILQSLLAQCIASGGQLSARTHAAAARGSARRAGMTAVLPLHGMLAPRADGLLHLFGGTSTNMFQAALREAVADDAIDSIFIDVDSPGGAVYGAGETADAVFRARAVKPVYALANSCAGSAAYWIGSNASQFFVTPGGEVGSIGVYTTHIDLSKANEEAGVGTTLISAGKYKTEGNSLGPLEAEARKFVQKRVDDYYAAFTRSVARGRRVSVDVVRGGMGQGRMLGADAAFEAGLVDGIATFDEVVRRMRSDRSAGAAKASALMGRVASTQPLPNLARARRELELLILEGSPVPK